MFYRFIFVLYFSFGYSQVPSYYNNIDFNQSPDIIKNQLSSLITNTHTTFYPYTSSTTDTWDILKLSDEVITSSTNVYLIYGYDDNNANSQDDYTRLKSLSCHVSGCSGLWNREHVFARSIATPPLVTDEDGAGTDIHNLKPCDGDMNSSRSNRLFDSGVGFSNITNTGNWFPGDEWKGDVARIIMYMFLRYDSQCLPNDIAISTNTYHSDMPDLFLEWNAVDPVSSLELQRNNVIASFQGNRNPFIDNPYLATLIWGGPFAQDTWNTFSVEENLFDNITIVPTFAEETITIKNTYNLNLNYSIFTISGRLLELNKSNNHVIDISHLSDGLYILELKHSQNKKVFRFIKK